MGKSLLSFCSRLILAVALFCLPMTALADDVTVFSGNSTSSYVPVYGTWVDSYTRTQIVLPADSLAGIPAGSSIESLTFYSGVSSKSWGAASFNVSLTETTGNVASAYVDLSAATLVYSGSVEINSSLMTVTFSTPYVYNGDNLVIDFSQQVSGTYSSAGIYGIDNYADGSSRYGYSSSGAALVSGYAISFVPKTTITFEPLAGSCPRPGAFVVSGLTANTATLTWGAASGVSSYELQILNGTTVEQSYILSDTSKALTGLSSATDYSMKVRSICGAGDTSSWRSGTFTTSCDIISSLPWKESFSGTSLPHCWNISGTTTNSYNWASYASGFVGRGLRFNSYNASTGLSGILETPDIAIPAAGYELTFLCKNPTGGDFDIAIAEAGSTAQTTLLTGLTSISSWTKKIIDLSAYAGKTVNIYFIGTSNFGSGDAYIYLDEVEVRETPSCRPGTDIKLASVTKTSATFSWTPANGETNWLVRYKKSSDYTYTTEQVSDTTLTISGLTASTVYKYEIHLLSLCGGVESPDSTTTTIQFSSECDIIEAVNDTIKMGFENYDNNSVDDLPCWLAYTANNPDACGWTVMGYTLISGTKLLAGNVIENNVPAIAIFPEINLPEGSEVSYKCQGDVSYYDPDTLKVYYNSTASLEGATLLDSVVVNNFSEAAFRRCQLTGFRNNGHLIVWVNGPSAYQKVLIDDVTFDPAPSCLPPTDLKQTGLTSESVTFSWTPGASETAWNITLEGGVDSISEGSIYDEASVENTPSYTLDGLSPATAYVLNVTVQSHCGEGNESVEKIEQQVSFITPCTPLDGSSFNAGDTVFAYGFESTESENWSAGWVDSEHPCFVNTAGPDASTLYGTAYVWTVGAGPTEYGSVTNGPHTGDLALYLNNGTSFSSSADALFILPGITTSEAGDFEISLYAAAGNTYSWSTYPDSLKIWVNNSPSLTGATLLLAENHPETTYSKYSAIIPLTGTVYVIIEGKTNTFSLLIDDVVLRRLPDCRQVQNARFENVTETSANLVWTPGHNETAWNLQVVNGTDTLINAQVTDTVYALTALTDGTDYSYDVRIAALCGGVEAAEVYTGTLDLTTKCYPYVLSATNGWSESFDARATGDIDFTCWKNVHITGDGTSVFQVYYDSYDTGDNFTNVAKLPDMKKGTVTLLSLPDMTVPEADAYEFKISVYRATSTASYAAEGLRIYANDTELGFISRNYQTADATHGIPAETAADWYTYTFTLPAAGLTTIKIQGESQYGSSTYFDDLAVRKIPTCIGATAAVVLDSLKTANSVTIGWTGSSASYKVSYTLGEISATDVVVTEPQITISGLQPSNAYNVNLAVVAVCSETEEAVDTLKASLACSTLCQALNYPYAIDFENAEEDEMPVCWETFTTGSSSYYTVKVYNSSYSSHNSQQCLYFYGGSTTYTQYAFMPEFNEDLNQAHLKFYYKNSSTGTSYGQLIIGVASDPDNVSTFIPMDTLERISSYTLADYEFSGVPDSCKYICFKFADGNYTGSLYIDDIRVTKQNTCKTPSALQVDSVSGATAYLSWTGNNQSYNIILVDAAGDTIANALTSASAYALSGLNLSTHYALNAYIYGYCSETEVSDPYEGAIAFNTECSYIASFPWTTGFEESEGFTEYASAGDAPCFSTISIYTSDSTEASNYWKVNNSSYNAHAGEQYLTATYASSETNATLTLPEFRFDGTKQYKLTYWYKHTGSYPSDSLFVNVYDGANWTLCIDSISVAASDYDWAESTAYINGIDGLKYISFLYVTNDGYSVYLDDVTIEENGVATSERSIYGNLDEEVTKFVRDGHVYILYRGVIYNVTGQKVEVLDK